MTTERDIKNQIVYARDKGMEEGLEKGREEGMAKGMEKGMEKGVRLMAEQLRRMGLPEEEIERMIVEAKAGAQN